MKQSDTYFCYDPYKLIWFDPNDFVRYVINEACPSGLSEGQSCNPWDHPRAVCIVTPIDSSSCCKGVIGGLNSTHYTCEAYQKCYGYSLLYCYNEGPGRNYKLRRVSVPNSNGCFIGEKCGRFVGKVVPTAVPTTVPTLSPTKIVTMPIFFPPEPTAEPSTKPNAPPTTVLT